MDNLSRPMDGPDSLHLQRKRRFAIMMLLIGCVFWGGSFAWQKNAGNSINIAAGLEVSHPLGQMLLLGWRFAISSLLWVVIFPFSLRGWSKQTVFRSIVLGGVFGIGIVFQATGLAMTSAGLSAFLTSLTIIFVPMMMMVAMKKSPSIVMWVGVAIATFGIYLFTGATSGFDLGALLGLACALTFSLYLILLNHLSPGETPWRLMLGQLIVVMLVSLAGAVILYPHLITQQAVMSAMHRPAIWNVLCLAVFATLIANGLMVFFQPNVDPTRAAMTYLTEPIFAATFAYFVIDEKLSTSAMIGGGLILGANLLVELWEMHVKSKAAQRRFDAITRP